MKKLSVVILAFLLSVLNVFALGALSIAPASYPHSGLPETLISGNFWLDNTGSVNITVDSTPKIVEFSGPDDLIQLIILNPSSNSYRITPEAPPVQFSYSFTIPSNQKAGSYIGDIVMTDLGNSTNSATHEVLLTVNEAPDISLSLPSVTIAKGNLGVATLTIANVGNTNLVTSINVSDLVKITDSTVKISRSNIQIANPSLALAYGETKSTSLTISVPSTAEATTYRADVTVAYNGRTETVALQVTVLTPTFSIEVSSLDFGEVSQNSTVIKSFTIKNIGNMDLKNVVITSNLASKYNAQLSQTSIAKLTPNQQTSVDLRVTIPANENTGLHSLGTLTILADNLATQTFNVNANVKGKLEIDKLDSYVDGNSDTGLKDGDTIDDKAKPGSKVELRLKLENLFDEDVDDIEIQDIEINVYVRGIDDEEDIELTADGFDLNAEEKSDTITLNFEVPMQVEDKTYDIDIEIEGEDENSVRHEINWQIHLDVEKKSHEIIISKAKLSTDTVSCDRNVDLELEIMNIGRSNEDEVKLTADSSSLNLKFSEDDIEIKEWSDDEEESVYTKTIPLTLPVNLRAGNYPITIKAYYDTDQLDDLKTVTLKVENCATQPPEEEELPVEKNETEVVIQPPKEEEIVVPPTTTVATTEQKFTETTTFFIMLILANVIGIVLVILLIVKLFFRS